MSPKSTPAKTDKISLVQCKFGLANSVLWDREILCDFIADRLSIHSDRLYTAAEKMDGGAQRTLFEVGVIADALHDHAGAGMQTEIEVRLDGIAGFVKWSKEELFSSLVEQVVHFASDFRSAEVSEPVDIIEVINLSEAVLRHDNPHRLESIEEYRMAHEPRKPAGKKAA